MVSIPLSYGSSFTGLGRCGARKRDRNSGITGKITATTRKRAIGPNVPSTYAQYSERLVFARSAPLLSQVGPRWAILPNRERRLAVASREAALRRRDVRAHRAAVRPDEHATYLRS